MQVGLQLYYPMQKVLKKASFSSLINAALNLEEKLEANSILTQYPTDIFTFEKDEQ